MSIVEAEEEELDLLSASRVAGAERALDDVDVEDTDLVTRCVGPLNATSCAIFMRLVTLRAPMTRSVSRAIRDVFMLPCACWVGCFVRRRTDLSPWRFSGWSDPATGSEDSLPRLKGTHYLEWSSSIKRRMNKCCTWFFHYTKFAYDVPTQYIICYINRP